MHIIPAPSRINVGVDLPRASLSSLAFTPGMNRWLRACHDIVLAHGDRRARVDLGLVGQDGTPGVLEAGVALVEDVFHRLLCLDDARVEDLL